MMLKSNKASMVRFTEVPKEPKDPEGSNASPMPMGTVRVPSKDRMLPRVCRVIGLLLMLHSVAGEDVKPTFFPNAMFWKPKYNNEKNWKTLKRSGVDGEESISAKCKTRNIGSGRLTEIVPPGDGEDDYDGGYKEGELREVFFKVRASKLLTLVIYCKPCQELHRPMDNDEDQERCDKCTGNKYGDGVEYAELSKIVLTDGETTDSFHSVVRQNPNIKKSSRHNFPFYEPCIQLVQKHDGFQKTFVCDSKEIRGLFKQAIRNPYTFLKIPEPDSSESSEPLFYGHKMSTGRDTEWTQCYKEDWSITSGTYTTTYWQHDDDETMNTATMPDELKQLRWTCYQDTSGVPGGEYKDSDSSEESSSGRRRLCESGGPLIRRLSEEIEKIQKK